MENTQPELFGKMSPEHSVQMKDRISKPSFKKSPRLQGGALSIPRPAAREDDTIWEPAGAVVGDGWSLAWRTLDAQYWGVPQRRRRVFVVADFRSECAREVLFKPESLPGHTAESGAPGKGNPERVESGVSTAGVIDDQGGSNIACSDGKLSPCLRSETHGNLPIVCLENHPNDSRIKINEEGVVQTLSSRMGTGGGNVPLIFEPGIASRDGGHIWQNDIAPSLRACPGDNLPAVCLPVYCIQGNTIDRSDNAGANGKGINENVSFTLNTIDRHAVAFTPSGYGKYTEGVGTLKADGGDIGGGSETLLASGFAVRRLTPTECERLQGFPDGWTALGHDNKKISDSARYKALGNSVALPCIEYLMRRIVEAA